MDNIKLSSEYDEENGGLGENILDEMDAYWEDINERLTISRVVSDSVIRGIVNAVEQEAEDRIAKKELEVIELKKVLPIYHVGSEEVRAVAVQHESHEAFSHNFSDFMLEHDRMIESVNGLKIAANDQLMELKKEINKISGTICIRRVNSGSELVGLSGIQQETVSDKCNFDKTFESLEASLDTFCRRIKNIAVLSKASLSEWQLQQEFRSETEGMVIKTCIQGLKEEFEWKLCGQNSQIDSQCGNWFQKFKEISSLRQELDSISRTLHVSETGQLIFYGSFENGEEWCHNKRTDHFHWKPPTNHISPTSDGNGKHEDSTNNKSETQCLEPASLKHMSRDELVTYYNSEITKMRRNHESQVQEITEENFRLRRELYKERGSSLPLKKDKEFDMLRKKIPDVISKLDKILVGNEKVHVFSESIESLSSLKDRLESLQSENHRLESLLMDKEKEVKHLTSELSDAVERLSLQQLIEKNLLQTVQRLECDMGDANAEVSVFHDVYLCLLGEILGEFRRIAAEAHMKHSMMEEMYEIIFKEAAHNSQPSSGSEIEDADVESIIMLGLLNVVYKGALMDAEEKLENLNMIYVKENLTRGALEMESSGYKEALRLETAGKEKLKQDMLILTSKLEEKEKSAQEATDLLLQEKRKMELASKELNSLREKTTQQQNVISKSNNELDAVQHKLVGARKEIEEYKEQVHKLNQDLERRTNELREIDEERRVLLALTQEKQDALTMIESKETETRKQMESTVVVVRQLLSSVADFESRTSKDISAINLRLKNMSSEFHCLINMSNRLKAVGLVYEKRLETRCSDLAKAEAEVDLLGDEVDTLLSLLEKIYIALDHYSHILRHYPGFTEILELVRRELSGESGKPV